MGGFTVKNLFYLPALIASIALEAVKIKGTGGAVINSGPLYASFEPCGVQLDIGFKFGFVGDPPGSGTTISHFKFENVAFPVFSRGANNVTVIHCMMINALQGVTNRGGSGWKVSHNKINGLQTANGGGIGILVGDSEGGDVTDNVVSHNKILGTLNVADPSCEGGGYDGSGIVLYADFRGTRAGADEIKDNRVVKNKVRMFSDTPALVDIVAFELTDTRDDVNATPYPVIFDNSIGFNDWRGTAWQMDITPDDLVNHNKISRNLGNNRGHGLHPRPFWPGGN
jgi:hypothetical protein